MLIVAAHHSTWQDSDMSLWNRAVRNLAIDSKHGSSFRLIQNESVCLYLRLVVICMIITVLTALILDITAYSGLALGLEYV